MLCDQRHTRASRQRIISFATQNTLNRIVMSAKTLNKDPVNRCLPADCPAGPPRVIICGVRQASFASETVRMEYKDEDYVSQLLKYDPELLWVHAGESSHLLCSYWALYCLWHLLCFKNTQSINNNNNNNNK